MTAERRRGTIYTEAVSAMTRMISQPGTPSTADVARAMGANESELATLFPDSQLLQASLENAVVLLHDQCVKSVVKIDPEDPLGQFMALSDAYIEWASDHPQEFVILGTIPAGKSAGGGDMLRYERALHELMIRLLRQAQAKGLLDDDADLSLIIATSRSFAFGVANKMLSGNLTRWMEGESGLEAARRALHLFTRCMVAPKG